MKTIQRNDCGNLQEGGAALVVTLIVCAVLAMVVVALMQNTGLDRSSSRSIANQYRAKLAADSGLAAAAAAISTNATNDTFIVVANPTNGQLFIGNGIARSANFSYKPLFSVVPNLTNAVSAVVTNRFPTYNATGVTTNFTNWALPGGLSISSPVISWVYLTNSSGQTNARFAYWVEDLGGRLDLGVVGTSDATAARRPTGTNAGEIALWSVFDSSSATAPANATATALISARSNILTTATARLVDAAVTTNLLAELAAGLRQDTNEPEVIPFGLGYDADEGKPKYNLNTNINAAGIGVIASAINNNLPLFGNRGGAMAAAAYVNNIAASIIDYADADSISSTDGANPPAWRGVEAIPWPNEIFTRIWLDSAANPVQFDPATGEINFKVSFKEYVEVWNLSSTTLSNVGSTCTISNNMDFPLQVSNWFGNLKTADTNNPPRIVSFTNSISSLPPNSYGVLAADTRVIKFSVNTNLTGGNTNARPVLNGSVFSQPAIRANAYTFFVDGQPVSASRGGRAAQPGSGGPLRDIQLSVGSFRYVVSAVMMGTEDTTFTTSRSYNLSGGDPRAQLFMGTTNPMMGLSYTNDGSRGGSTPGGRNRLSGAQGAARTVEPELNWPDGGHSLGESGSDVGTTPATSSTAPTIGFGMVDTNQFYLQKMNNTGRFTNVSELGNIFDPIQWADPGNPFYHLDNAAWMGLSASATPFAGAGGRNSLRIGRPEHVKFAVDGQRASQLLDIFAASANAPGPGGVVRSPVAGKININTAGTNALRALAAGVGNSIDRNLRTNAASIAGTNFVVPTNAVGAFIAGVTNFRSQRPFFSAVQLAQITTNSVAAEWPTNAVFGNFGPTLDSSTYPVSALRSFSAGNPNVGRVTEWTDEAAEEWFSRVYPLATVRSRNFLVHVIGQALQTNGITVLSTSRKLFQIYIEPIRATAGSSAGLTTNSVPRVLATWDL